MINHNRNKWINDLNRIKRFNTSDNIRKDDRWAFLDINEIDYLIKVLKHHIMFYPLWDEMQMDINDYKIIAEYKNIGIAVNKYRTIYRCGECEFISKKCEGIKKHISLIHEKGLLWKKS